MSWPVCPLSQHFFCVPQVFVMLLQLPLVVTAQVDLVLLLVSLLALWTRLSHLGYPNAVV